MIQTNSPPTGHMDRNFFNSASIKNSRVDGAITARGHRHNLTE